MTPRRMLIRALDRLGSRWLLGLATTWYGRTTTGRDISVWHDDLWMRRLDNIILADTPHFDYFAKDICQLPAQVQQIFRDVEDYWFHIYRPRPGDVIVDVGAGAGWDTLVFSRVVGPSGRVLSIEAHPSTFRQLRRLCERNQLRNTTCLQLAIVDRQREVFMKESANPLAHALSQTPTPLRIRGYSLDDVCAEWSIDRVDFLKMNIEGAERNALAGMEHVLTQTRACCIACHDHLAGKSSALATKELVADFLRDHGFTVITRAEDGRPWARDHVHAIR